MLCDVFPCVWRERRGEGRESERKKDILRDSFMQLIVGASNSEIMGRAAGWRPG